MAYIAPEEADLQKPNYPTAYIGDIDESAMMPNSDWHHVLHMPHRYPAVGYSALMALSFGLQPRLSIRGAYSGEWGDWIPIATATPPQVYDLPLAAGVERQGNDMCAYWKNQFGEVTAIAAVHFQRTAKDYNPSIGWLPAGFRPSIMIEKPASFSTPEGRVAGTVLVFPDGTIHLIYDHMGETFSCFEVSFVASA